MNTGSVLSKHLAGEQALHVSCGYPGNHAALGSQGLSCIISSNIFIKVMLNSMCIMAFFTILIRLGDW